MQILQRSDRELPVPACFSSGNLAPNLLARYRFDFLITAGEAIVSET